MRIERTVTGPLQVNCWVIADAGNAVVIDPGGDVPAVLGAVGTDTVSAIVLTHAHFDHLGGVRELAEATGAPVLVHEADAHRITSDDAAGTGGALFGFPAMTSPPADRTLVHGDVIDVGRTRLSVVHTPGHTAGSICLLLEDPDTGFVHLFSGDTLFAGSVGRTDLPGGDARALARSIATRLAVLPPATRVHPGHGPDTTIEREARINPFWPRA